MSFQDRRYLPHESVGQRDTAVNSSNHHRRGDVAKCIQPILMISAIFDIRVYLNKCPMTLIIPLFTNNFILFMDVDYITEIIPIVSSKYIVDFCNM